MRKFFTEDLFEGFDESLNLEHVRLLQSSLATHITYRVRR